MAKLNHGLFTGNCRFGTGTGQFGTCCLAPPLQQDLLRDFFCGARN
jgi:hypothetical protein